MSLTSVQKEQAEKYQIAAAEDQAQQIRLIAGPGTGKSSVIEKRVAYLLSKGVLPNNIYVTSFTRAACNELKSRIINYCSTDKIAKMALHVRVSTMHSLALQILRRANLLTCYPGTPIILDEWELNNVYDNEFACSLGCTVTRAKEIRIAHDAKWQTLDQDYINQAQITPHEIQGFNAFHSARTNLYCCVLPGEVIYKCVGAINQGILQIEQIIKIDHLIIDEYQDLNACDQEFIRLLASNRTTMFVAGDDDQSIYSFRHANPDGIIQFNTIYPASTTHVLKDCFRCTPSILEYANRLIQFNANRVNKELESIYEKSEPPVRGKIMAWNFRTAQEEACAIANSCRVLINEGMSGRENEILILISNRKVQLKIIIQELSKLGIPFETPRGELLIHENEVIRAIYSIIRIVKDKASDTHDYPAYRDLLEVLSDIGSRTLKEIAESCILKNQNFRQLFYLEECPPWLSKRSASAVQRMIKIVQSIKTWCANDTLATRKEEINNLISSLIILPKQNNANEMLIWNSIADSLPSNLTLEELQEYLSTDSEAEQQGIINLASERINNEHKQPSILSQNRVKILTMHGAKGLSGKIVFIPGAENGLIPSSKAVQATGLLIEQRRLLYVSITRAKACCILSHAAHRYDYHDKKISSRTGSRMSRSQFLSEMNIASISRNSGLSHEEATSIINDVNMM